MKNSLLTGALSEQDSQRGTVQKNSDRRVAPFSTGYHWQCHQAMACSIEGVCSWKRWPLWEQTVR